MTLTALLLCLRTHLAVPLHAANELLAALGVTDVLDTDVDTLLHVPVADDLVHDDSNCMWSNVVDDAGTPVQLTFKKYHESVI